MILIKIKEGTERFIGFMIIINHSFFLASLLQVLFDDIVLFKSTKHSKAL